MTPARHAGLLEELRERYPAAESQRYLAMHERRYELLLNDIAGALAEMGVEEPRVLDVGAAYEAEALRRLLPSATVDTLGFPDDRFPPREHERHVELDLNDAERFHEPLHSYDITVLAEVIEHLHVSPLHVLRLVRRALKPGGRLVLQTPNAASLHNRLVLVAGRNPFEPIRERGSDPGHFREYTVDELLELAGAAGLRPLRWFTGNYFRTGSRRNRLFAATGRLIPARLRAGITLWSERPRD